MRFACLAAVSTILASVPLVPVPAEAQEAPDAEPRIRIFFDCHARGCDFDYFRREIDFVDWVRSREDSHVHLLITSEATGSGGQALEIAFLGRAEFLGVGDTLTHGYGPTDTEDERRSGLAAVVRAGLVPYLARSGQLDRVEIRSRVLGPAGAGEGRGPRPGQQTAAADDPWNFWIFNVGLNAFLSGQSTTSSSNTSWSASAARTTDLWKAAFRVLGSYSARTFELSGGKETFITRGYSASGSIVRSLTDHWSTGAQATVLHDTQLNQDLTLRLAPAIEYNIYPYTESSRRQLILQYSLGANTFDYTEETLFGKTSEALFDHTLAAAVEQTEPWGSVNAQVTGSQFLNRSSRYSVTVSGGAQLRLTRGLSLRMSGTYSWIRDQLHLSGAALEDDQILLRLRDLETSFRYFTSIGFTYQFGSIFNNVVNPRLRFRGRSGGGAFFF